MSKLEKNPNPPSFNDLIPWSQGRLHVFLPHLLSHLDVILINTAVWSGSVSGRTERFLMCKFSKLWKRRFLSETRAFAFISMCSALLCTCQATGLRQMKRILTGVPAFNNEPFHLRIKALGRTWLPYHSGVSDDVTHVGPQCVYLTTSSCWSCTQQSDGTLGCSPAERLANRSGHRSQRSEINARLILLR